MSAVRAASGDQPSRLHTVGFVGLGLAVALTFLVLWAVFFRGAASDVSHQGNETAGLAPAPAPGSVPDKNSGTEPAATQPTAPRSTEPRSAKSTQAGQASGRNGPGSEEVNPTDQLGKSANAANEGLAIGTLSPVSAKTTYEDFAGDYAAASGSLGALTSDTRPAQLQAAVRQAAAAYEVWIRQLQSTTWPPEVQPYVDDYLALATTKGRALFKQSMHAQSVDDLQSAGAIGDMFELSHAQEMMRAAIGASN